MTREYVNSSRYEMAVFTRRQAITVVGGLLTTAGCLQNASGGEVVVYTALDREFSEPLFEDFQRQTGFRVRAKYDTEANKTVGLTSLLLAERNRPRCDVFWNNEILNTLRLESAGLLAPHASATGLQYPPMYRSPTNHWFGFAARARVLLVNTRRLGETAVPGRLQELTSPQWKGQVGFAKPLFGTTATHAACLYAVWGHDKATEFFQRLADQGEVLPGNRQVAQAVGQGRLTVGWTDTDDAIIELRRGSPVTIIFPDQEPDGLGTLFIPNTLAILAGGPNPPAARKLIDFLLSESSERQLADGASVQIPLQPSLRGYRPSGGWATEVATPDQVRSMQVDFRQAARQWDAISQTLRNLFAQAT